MWRRTVYFLFFLQLGFSATTMGNSKIDSLQQILPNLQDESKVEVLCKLSWEFKNSDISLAEQYANQAIELSEKISYQEGKGKALRNLAVVHSINNQFVESNQASNLAIDVFRSLNDLKSIANCWTIFGINARKRGNFDEAFEQYNNALGVYETLMDTTSILKIEGNIANLQYIRGDYSSAQKTYQRIITYQNRIGNSEEVARQFGNIARSYSKQGNYPLALENFYSANQILDSLNISYEISNNLNNIGLIYYQLEMFSEAIASLEQGLLLSDNLKNTKRKADLYNNLGNCYLQLNDISKAKDYYEKSLQILEILKIEAKGSLLLNFGNIAYKEGDFSKALNLVNEAFKIDSISANKDNLAQDYHVKGKILYAINKVDAAAISLEKSLELWQEIGALPKIESTASLLIKIYRQKKQLNKAFQTQDILDKISDSLAITNKNSLLRAYQKVKVKVASSIKYYLRV